jgi:hypothetical protein
MAQSGRPDESIRQIGVRPFAAGWAVSEASFDNSQFFKSGSRAEDAARNLGARFAGAGHASEITIYLRDGSLGGRFMCPTEGVAERNEGPSAW